jgi:nitrite reductase/ring-hydroxylating ferredoxin subunit
LSTHRLCAVNEIPDGDSIEFMVPFQGRDRSLISVRKDGEVYLYLNSCPHTGLTLDFTPNQFLNLEKTHILCANHMAYFEIDTGLCISDPCPGEKLTPINFEIRDDAVYLLSED